jgi:hypothetical protein
VRLQKPRDVVCEIPRAQTAPTDSNVCSTSGATCPATPYLNDSRWHPQFLSISYKCTAELKAKCANKGEELTNWIIFLWSIEAIEDKTPFGSCWPQACRAETRKWDTDMQRICKQCKCMKCANWVQLDVKTCQVMGAICPPDGQKCPTHPWALFVLFQSPFAQANFNATSGCLWNRQELPQDHKWFRSVSDVQDEPLPKALRTRRFHPHLPEVTT